MERTEVVIARLVLGYLKNQKCRTAYKEFLKTSTNLQSDLLARTKYLPTRFVGLTLDDILNEYFEILRIVQGRLEASNYYNECHTRTSLVHQLLYLLSKDHASRTSTPCPRSPLESSLDETSPRPLEQISDVETTPAHTLPGNVRCTSEDSYLYKTPRRRSNSKSNKSATVANLQTAEDEDMSEILAQTLLENREFHEKIAQTINKVAEKRYRVSTELDRTIKTVVEETEADPIFDKILEEIIGSASATENCKGAESSSTTSSTGRDVSDDVGSLKRTQKQLYSNQSMRDLDQSLRINGNSQTVDQQNDEAIRSIVATSNLSEAIPIENNQEDHVNNEVTVFDGSLDKYLISNTSNSQTLANSQTKPLDSLYINTTAGLLLVHPAVTSYSNVKLDPTKQYYIINKEQPVNWPLAPIKTSNIITAQDILAMPTVIVNDQKQNIVPASQLLLQTPISTTRKTNPTIVPKPTIEIPAEYLNTINGNEIQQQKGLKNVIYPKKIKETKLPETTTATTSCESTTNVTSSVLSSKKKSLPDDLLNEEQVPEVTNSEQLTPAPVIERVQKTPKSGSHIRNLDFSTPPKITSTHKKSLRSKVDNQIGNKSPPFIHKKQAAKSLLNLQNSVLVDTDHTIQNSTEMTELKKNTSFKIWDADLRVNLLPVETKSVKNIKLKKKKTPVRKVKRNNKNFKAIKKKQLKAAAEREAAIIEAALQTPNKSDINCEKSVLVKDGSNKEDHIISDNTSKKEIHSKLVSLENNITSKTCDSSDLHKETDESTTSKTVLSPSKLNANKRKLVSSDITDKGLLKSVDETNKFITPEMIKENFNYPIKANRNITSMFDTPMKNEYVPKTPGIHTPNTSLNTPFTKMLEENLKGIDISSLPTPNIPITPNFPPFTPNVELLSPYSNRPTDYSTSSSYYQPSDSEPNRSLEANVIEIEKQPVTVLSSVIIPKENEDVSQEDKSENTYNINLPSSKLVVNEHLNVFNKNVIGKKNLSLMERNASSSSSSSGNSSSESYDEEDNVSSCNWMEKSNETVIFNKKSTETPKRTYSLRSRTAVTCKKEEKAKTSMEVSEIVSNKKQARKDTKASTRQVTNSNHKYVAMESKICSKNQKEVDIQVKKTENENPIKEVNNTKSKEHISLQQAALKKELNEKLVRTLKKIKTVEKHTEKKSRASNAKFMKIKLLPNQTKSRRTKSESPKKNVRNGAIDTKIDLYDGTNLDDNGSRCSKENVNKVKTVTSTRSTKNSEQNDKSASDIEAQNLIEGLKERELDKNPNNKYIKNDTSVDIKNNTTEENHHERSSSQLDTEWRETYDTKTFEGEHECVVFDESKIIIKTFEDYNIKILEKTFVGKVFIEEIDKEIDVPVVFSPFYSLLEIPSTKKFTQNPNTLNQNIQLEDRPSSTDYEVSTKTDNKRNLVSEEDHVIKGTVNEEKIETPSIKKRKIEKENCCVSEEKQCKTLLQKINVDTFLNNIHGKN